MTLRLGTRGSALARWQADWVADRLAAAGHDVEIVTFTTKGDRILDRPLAEIGSKGLFTEELDRALIGGDLHLAVHSLKDLPTTLPDGLALAAVPERAAHEDAFVAHPSFAGALADLPDGATVATSSLRRQAQLLAWRSDLRIVSVRGNVPTRLRKLAESDWHGMILATAGLERLGLGEHIRERIGAGVMLSAVGQGALGVVARADDDGTREALAQALHHPPTAAAVLAERALMRRLEGGCQVPVAGHATVANGRITLAGAVVSLDGRQAVRGEQAGADPEALGISLADELLERGGGAILNAIRA